MPPGHGHISRDVINIPEVQVYIEDFGKPDDICLAAETGGIVIGAAWSRILFHPGKKGYGNIDEHTPELAISILPEYRGMGTGTKLLESLYMELESGGYRQISLSVQKENPAVRLYTRTGFTIIGNNEEDYIMLKRLIGADQPVAFGLSLEELWKLFPIELKEYDPQYSKWYKEIKNELVAILGDSILRISHIGSTAVEGLLSKPIIDILLEIKHQDAVVLTVLKDRLVADGWLLMNSNVEEYLRNSFIEGKLRFDFNKGYTPQGFAEKAFHLHLVPQGDHDELYFRD